MKRRALLSASAALGLTNLFAPFLCLAEERGLSSKWHERMRPLMGTYVSIAIYDENAGRASELSGRCFSFMEQRIAEISDWDEASDTSRLLREHSVSSRQCHDSFLRLSRCAMQIAALTCGAYSPLSRSLHTLWREAKAAGSVPHTSDIKREMTRIARASFTTNDSIVSLQGESGFDFGGIGKGFMAEEAGAFLRKNGARFARVACSGDLCFIGETIWEVGVQHPREERTLGSIKKNGSFGVATSGDYRNFWFVNGRRYHHLIDHRTGQPGRFCQQATVFHPSPTIADGLATATFFMPPLRGIAFIEQLPDSEAIIIDAAGNLHHTSGLTLTA